MTSYATLPSRSQIRVDPRHSRRAAKSRPREHRIHELADGVGNHTILRFIRRPTFQPKLAISQPGDPYEREADRVAEPFFLLDLLRRGTTEQPSPSVHPILQLQHTYGNHAVTRLFESRGVQVGRQGDQYEQEAERMADQVMHMPDSDVQRHPETDPSESAEPTNQSSAVMTVASREALSPRLRAFFEARFGHDFSGVRIHADTRAAESAQALGASAYTVGRHIVFGERQYAPDTAAGRRLLAHELTHVVQQDHRRDTPSLQRQSERTEPEWLPELDAILPRGVGPIAHIGRVQMLADIFGIALLEQHVRLIYADAAATRFAHQHGVPGIVALYDTRRGDQLDVTAAEKALANSFDRYRLGSIERLRLAPREEAPRSYWFQDPATQRQGDDGESEFPLTSSELRAQVFVESSPTIVKVPGIGVVFVRFAYPEPEIGVALSERVARAKKSIAEAIGNVMADLTGLPPAASREERREQLRVRARLREVWRGLNSESSPLNVFIAPELTAEEMRSQQVAATIERIFVRFRDVDDPSKLQAAIRIPLMMLHGGRMPGPGGIGNVPAASPSALGRTVLHEALHAMLIRRASDANTIWEAHRSLLTIKGSPSAGPKLVELVRKYLIAQEEVFSYDTEASLYPPVSPTKALYELFMKQVERFLKQRRLVLVTESHAIPVSKRVARRPVSWTIIYRIPSGIVELTVDDIPVLDLLLSVYPLASLFESGEPQPVGPGPSR